MPKARVTKIVEVTKGEIVDAKDEVVDETGIPTPAAQAEIMHPEDPFHTIHLLDGTEIEMRKELTIADVEAKRLYGKMLAFRAIVLAECKRLEDVLPNDATRLEVVFASSEPVFHAIVDLLAKLTGQPVLRFLDNINETELITAFGIVNTAITALQPKNPQTPTTTKK